MTEGREDKSISQPVPENVWQHPDYKGSEAPWIGVASACVSAGLAFALYWQTSAPDLTWAHYGADGGEFMIRGTKFEGRELRFSLNLVTAPDWDTTIVFPPGTVPRDVSTYTTLRLGPD